MGIMVYSLLCVMQDLCHQPYHYCPGYYRMGASKRHVNKRHKLGIYHTPLFQQIDMVSMSYPTVYVPDSKGHLSSQCRLQGKGLHYPNSEGPLNQRLANATSNPKA